VTLKYPVVKFKNCKKIVNVLLNNSFFEYLWYIKLIYL